MRIAFVFLLAAIAQSVAAAEPGTGKPSIHFETTVHDFGTINQHAQNEVVFKFQNDGDAVLTIERTQTTCGCTVAMPSENNLDPGMSGEVKVTFNSQDFSGPIHKQIVVHSNDPEHPEVPLDIKANVLADLVCTPLSLDLGEIGRDGARAERAVKVFSPSGRKFKILSAKSSLGFLTTEIVPPAEDGGQYQVKIRVNGAPAGGFTGSVLIQTDIEKLKPVPITVSGNVHMRTELIPPRLFFAVVCVGETPTRELIVRANQWEGLKIEKVDAPETLSVATEELKPGKEWRLAVTFKGPAPEGLYKDKITIHLNDEEMKQAEVPVVAMIRKCTEKK